MRGVESRVLVHVGGVFDPEPQTTNSEARAAQAIRRGRAGVDVGELGRALADRESEVYDGAAARGAVGPEAGRSVPLPQRGLVALDRARADAGAVAGAQVRYERGTFAVTGSSMADSARYSSRLTKWGYLKRYTKPGQEIGSATGAAVNSVLNRILNRLLGLAFAAPGFATDRESNKTETFGSVILLHV